MLEIVSKDSIPQSGTGKGQHLSPRIAEIFDALASLDDNKALKYQCDNQKDANYLQVNLRYHSKKGHRCGMPNMANLRCAIRDTIVFIWLEKKGQS